MRVLILSLLFITAYKVAVSQSYVKGQARALAVPVRLVVLGSSTAAGAGARPIDSAWVYRYRAYLKRLHPDCELINLAKSGYQSFHLMPDNYQPPNGYPAPDLERNIHRALSLRPDGIIINLPSNDAAAGYDVATQLHNLDAIAHTAWAADVPVWFISVQPRNFDSLKVKVQLQMLEAVQKRYPDRFISVWHLLATPKGTLDPRWDAGDGIHLNNRGHAMLFEQVVAQDIPFQLVHASAYPLYALEERWSNIVPPSDNALRHPVIRSLPPATLLLKADQPMTQVNIAIFDANGRLIRQLTTDLPYLLPSDSVQPGVYRVRMRKGAWEKSVRWVKML